MVKPSLVLFDGKGDETSRQLMGNEYVSIHYDDNPEAGCPVDVEVTAVVVPSRPTTASARIEIPQIPEVRVNIRDGVSLLFDTPDDARCLLGIIAEEVRAAVALWRRQHPVMEDLPFPIYKEKT